MDSVAKAQKLFDSILAEDVRMVRRLLKIGADPNVVLPNGASPIHVAVGIDNSTVSELLTTILVDNGADPNVRSSDGSTPMHIAATYSRSENLKHLLQNGGDPFLQDFDGANVIENTSCDLCLAVIHQFIEGRKDNSKEEYINESGSLSGSSYHTCGVDGSGSSCERSVNGEETVVLKGKLSLNASNDQSIVFDSSKQSIVYTIPLEITEKERQSVNSAPHKVRGHTWTIPSKNLRVHGKTNPSHANIDSKTFLVSKATLPMDITFVVPSGRFEKAGGKPLDDVTFTVGRSSSADSIRSSDFEFDPAELPSFRPVTENHHGNSRSPVLSLHSKMSQMALSDPKTNRRHQDLEYRQKNYPWERNFIDLQDDLQDNVMPDASLLTSDDSMDDTMVERCAAKRVPERLESTRIIEEFWDSYATGKHEDTICSITSSTFRPNKASTSIETDSDGPDDTADMYSLKVTGLNTLHQHLADVAYGSDSSFASSKTAKSQCSCHARAEELIITDEEEGFSLVEVHLIPEQCVCSSTCTSPDCNVMSPHNCSPQCCGYDSDTTVLYDWKDGMTDRETESESLVINPVPKEIISLTDGQLRSCLVDLGDSPGPILPSTRKQYEIRLLKLRRDRNCLNRAGPTASEFQPELSKALEGNLDLSSVQGLEDEMHLAFASPDPSKNWREGTKKASFNYLLLDPRVTQNLPLRAKGLSHQEGFKIFVKSVFYVGKGYRTRPYAHFKEAIRHLNGPNDLKQEPSSKVQQIIDIWKAGLGVISLHVFQNTIPVEAYTREACMIEAFGLARVTNKCKGQLYGPALRWSRRDIRTVGVRLLKKAYHILLFEGERQIKPHDIKTK